MPLIPLIHLADVDAAARAAPLAVLPLGAVEAHGPHLPLGTDLLLVEGLLDATAPLLPADGPVMLRLPTLWLGASVEHSATAGTLSQASAAMEAQIAAIATGLPALGVSRLVLLNGHGGNQAAAEAAAFSLRAHLGLLVAVCHWAALGLPPGLRTIADEGGDMHGGWRETALVLHLHPDLVSLDRVTAAPACPPSPWLAPQGPLPWGWATADVAGGRHIGHPERATAEIGAQLLAHLAQQLAAVLSDLAACRWRE